MINDFKKKSRERNRLNSQWNIKGQAVIFIIIAIVIVAGVIFYFLFKGSVIKDKIPKELEDVYSYYQSCIDEETLNGAIILGQQGGYIQQPDFEAGSSYMPFSSQLDFLGIGVPYWYYISGNGILKEQIPSKAKMESQLDEFLEERILECDFTEFESEGYVIGVGEPHVKTIINTNDIEVNVEQELVINFGNTTWSSENHVKLVKSSLGKFYDLARKIYLNWKETMFLENYGVDILRLYAPVDGSEIGCASKIWNVDKVRGDLINALESNIPATKIRGDYYNLAKKENKYFVQDIGEESDVGVNFMYVKDWPMKMEVWPSEDGILKADPIGLQEGLGMLGFCYVQYHFVYDFAYPVLIQLYNNEEMFQFPVVSSIEKNKPREALDAEGMLDVVPELCEHKNKKMTVYTYDVFLEPVPATIDFKCFDTTCDIGKTQSGVHGDAVLIDYFPQCVNGFIIAEAEGYERKKYLVESLEEDISILILEKEYKLDFEVQKAGREVDYAVVTFTKNDSTKTISYPEQKEIELTQGQYEIKVYVYSNSSIQLQGSQTEKCVDVPMSGVAGFFGGSDKKCFTMTIPNQIVSFAVSGGGKEQYYVAESQLQDSERLIISAPSFGIPNKVEDLQVNYNNVEVSHLQVSFV